MLCLAIVGLPGAGKSEFLQIASNNGFSCLEWSEIISPDLKQIVSNRDKIHEAAARLVQLKTESYYPAKIFKILNNQKSSYHAVSGARNPNELKYLLQNYSSFKVVWISSNYLSRFNRSIRRGRVNRAVDLEAFVREDIYELAHGLAEIACSLIDDILFNDSSLSTYKQVVIEYLDGIKNISK